MINTLVTTANGKTWRVKRITTKQGAKRSKIKQDWEYGANLGAVWYDANGTKHIIFG